MRGKNFLIYHGDDINVWKSTPYYGIERAVREFEELLASRDEFVDYFILGHFHRNITLPKIRGEVFINGGLKGGDEYSLGALRAVSRPSQLIAGVHDRTGVSFRYPVHFTRKEGKLRYVVDDA